MGKESSTSICRTQREEQLRRRGDERSYHFHSLYAGADSALEPLLDIDSTRTVDNYRDILEKQVIPAVEKRRLEDC